MLRFLISRVIQVHRLVAVRAAVAVARLLSLHVLLLLERLQRFVLLFLASGRLSSWGFAPAASPDSRTRP